MRPAERKCEMFTRVAAHRNFWRNADGVCICLPGDKKTFRIIDANGVEDIRRFRSFESAAKAAA